MSPGCGRICIFRSTRQRDTSRVYRDYCEQEDKHSDSRQSGFDVMLYSVICTSRTKATRQHSTAVSKSNSMKRVRSEQIDDFKKV